MMNKLMMECQFKSVGDDMSFTAYGNVKNYEDFAGDIAVDGCYAKSIDIHKQKGTTPKLLWGHDYGLPPVGRIRHQEEDSKGYLIDGFLSKTERGKELYILGKDEAIDSFSIGYNVIDERRDAKTGINYLNSIHIKEVSFVNFACNDLSLMQTIKSEIHNGNLPTERELERLLRECGMSRKQALAVASKYNPSGKLDIKQLSGYSMFN